MEPKGSSSKVSPSDESTPSDPTTLNLFSPVVRVGVGNDHYVLAKNQYDIPEDVPGSLQPPEINKLRCNLERSSSSFLKDLKTPPSTASEDEPGQCGLKVFCIGKKKHHVDPKLENPTAANQFGNRLLRIILIAQIPALLVQIAYVSFDLFRTNILLHYNISLGLFMSVLAFNLGLRYFSGLMRMWPWHIVMITARSITFAVNYTLICAGGEYLFISEQIRKDPNFEENKSEENWIKFYEKYVLNTEKLDANEESELTGEIIADEQLQIKNVMFLVGLLYAMFLMIMLIVLTALSKITFFGPIFPFISYTLTFGLILASTFPFLWEIIPRDDETIVFNIIQCIIAPLVGCIMVEIFIIFLNDLLNGDFCPLRQHEVLYAAAHF